MTHQSSFNVGDTIRCFDFHGRTDCYIDAVITRITDRGVIQGDIIKQVFEYEEIPADARNTKVSTADNGLMLMDDHWEDKGFTRLHKLEI